MFETLMRRMRAWQLGHRSIWLAVFVPTLPAKAEERHAVRISHRHLQGAPHGRIDTCAIEAQGAVLFLTEPEIAALGVPHERLGSLRDHAARFRPARTMAEIGVGSLSALLNEPFRPRPGGRVAAGITNLRYDRYHDPEEGITFFQNLAAAYPHIARLESIGQSVQGRDLWVLKLSDNPGLDEPGEYSTFFCALHHAREWATHESILYMAEYLTDHYDDDWLVHEILDHSVVWILLAANPDGFQLSWDVDRYQRTNANGVDLNRNYAYLWGYDDWGSSPYPGDEMYRGSGPASEPETQAIQNFLTAKRPVIAVTNHTYSQLVAYPWGYTGLRTAEAYTSLRAVADGYARHAARHGRKEYLPGPTNYTIYPINGDLTDYAYGALGILAYTPEQRPHRYDLGGFELPEDQLLDNARENMEASLWIMNLVARARPVQVPAGFFTPGLNRFALPLTPVNQQPQLGLGLPQNEWAQLSAYLNDALDHDPAVAGFFPADFEAVGVGSAYRFEFDEGSKSWGQSFADYSALPFVFDEGSMVMLQNVAPDINEIGIPGEEAVRLSDVSIVQRIVVESGHSFGLQEVVIEQRTALEDLANPSPWINWNWLHTRPDGSTELSHPTGDGGADRYVHPFKAYRFLVHVPSYQFYGSVPSQSVFLLRFPPPLHGDGDENGTIDSVDYGGFQACWTGPIRASLSPGCDLFDFDHDYDIDLKDLLNLQCQFGALP